MHTHTINKSLFRFGVVMVLLLSIAVSGIAQAKDPSQVAVSKAVDQNLAAVSNPIQAQSVSSNGLYFTAYSATQVATVGQAVYIIAKFVNKGKTTFTNLFIECPELGRSLVNISSTSYPTTVLPGQSGFQEQHWQAVRTGPGPIYCSLTATDTSTGQQVILSAPPINIIVK